MRHCLRRRNSREIIHANYFPIHAAFQLSGSHHASKRLSPRKYRLTCPSLSLIFAVPTSHSTPLCRLLEVRGGPFHLGRTIVNTKGLPRELFRCDLHFRVFQIPSLLHPYMSWFAEFGVAPEVGSGRATHTHSPPSTAPSTRLWLNIQVVIVKTAREIVRQMSTC